MKTEKRREIGEIWSTRIASLYIWYVNFLSIRFRVHLDTAENWKLKLKTEKYCNEIIFKCVNSTVGPICNKKSCWKVKFVGPWTVHDVHWLVQKSLKSSNLWLLFIKPCINSNHNMKKRGENKKKKANKTHTYQPNPNTTLIYDWYCSYCIPCNNTLAIARISTQFLHD